MSGRGLQVLVVVVKGVMAVDPKRKLYDLEKVFKMKSQIDGLV